MNRQAEEANKKVPQREKIRWHLLTKGSITPVDALKLYGCFRLASRISELRKEGWEIETETHVGIPYAIYRLVLPFETEELE